MMIGSHSILYSRDAEAPDVTEAPWGRLVATTLPGGGKLGVYEPKHARPPT